MEEKNLESLMAEIVATAGIVKERRGKYAAALWGVSNLLTDLSCSLVPFTDPKSLGCDESAHLVIECAAENANVKEELQGRFLLWIKLGDQKIPAYQAGPALSLSAVRRLPDFLQTYLKALSEAQGSETSLSQAEKIIQATYSCSQ